MVFDYSPTVWTYGINVFSGVVGESEPSDAVYDAGLLDGGVAVCVGAVAVSPPGAFGYSIAGGVVAGGGVPAGICFALGEAFVKPPRHYECFNLFGCLRCAYRGF